MTKTIITHPCPFCDKKHLGIEVFHATLSAKGRAAVVCKSCGARGPIIFFQRHKGLSEADSDKAVRYWNRASQRRPV